MGTLATVIEAPIRGALGTQVNVGDTVMVVTTGYSHRVSVKQGIYKGFIEGKYGSPRARIEITENYNYWVHKETGEEYDYRKHGYWKAEYKDVFERTSRPYVRKSTLNLNRIATITSVIESDTIDKIGKLV